MTDKELLYIEDVLAHEQFILTYCDDVLMKLQSEDSRRFWQSLRDQHQKTFETVKGLIC